VTSTPHTPNIFSSVLDDLQNRTLWIVGGLFPPSPPGGAALDGNHIEPLEQRQQEISIAKN